MYEIIPKSALVYEIIPESVLVYEIIPESVLVYEPHIYFPRSRADFDHALER